MSDMDPYENKARIAKEIIDTESRLLRRELSDKERRRADEDARKAVERAEKK